ncbi:MAG: hypothetical protein QF908_04320 [Dehalococcoidia bacterium]|nr:hypothetical protein [Dehalococcoidia bacterium]MDP7613183.1 hypothetical protein [Dehalococcoidia bacterium]
MTPTRFFNVAIPGSDALHISQESSKKSISLGKVFFDDIEGVILFGSLVGSRFNALEFS